MSRGVSRKAMWDTEYANRVIPDTVLQDIRCPTCGNLLARGMISDGTTLEFLCKRRSRNSRMGCGNKLTIQT